MTTRTDPGKNSASKNCPQCGQQLTNVGAFWVCPEHGQVSIEKRFTALRIFLSYGHDSNEELVRRIKADLERRGHDVWFDTREIKTGHDWRRSITDGILNSHRVLSVLSKHSTRDPGVCLDEIAIAIGVKGGNIQTILVESEHEVKPPASISHIQWLDMRDWKERRAAGETEWEQWYQAKLAEIVAVVESDESRRFAGEIKTLEEHLKPISSDSRIYQLLKKGLVGRAWLVEAIEEWRSAADRASRLFWIMGAPGVGKSAFAAHLAHYGRDKVIAVQFCEYDKPDHRNAHRIVRTLAFQLATRLPDYRKLLLTLPEIRGEELDRKNPAELFDYLLANPFRLSINGGRDRYLIVIDALDEAGGNGRNELVEMLARHAPRLPDWIAFVVTSRPESHVIAPLQGLNPFVLDTATESNRADIRDYLWRELASQLQNRPDADRLVEQILEKSEGVFLYAERFCDDVERGHLSLDHPEEFPQGLGGTFFQYFQRQFPDLEKFRKDVRPALRAILAAREPLPVEILQRLLNWEDEELRDFVRCLGSLFPVTTEAGHEVVKPYHKSLPDWLAEEAKAGPYFVSVSEGHRMLAPIGWLDYVKRAGNLSYWLRTLPEHLFGASVWEMVEVKTHKATITCLAFSDDGTLLASGDDSGAVGIWSIDSGHGKLLLGHSHRILSVVFSSDTNKRIVSSICFDGVVRKWAAISGECISVERGFEDMRGIAVAHDRDTLGHTTEGVWCGYRGDVQKRGTFGSWAQSVGTLLQINKPPDQTGSSRSDREPWYEVIKPPNWVNPLCDWDFECKHCLNREGFQREPPIACSKCGYDGRQ